MFYFVKKRFYSLLLSFFFYVDETTMAEVKRKIKNEKEKKKIMRKKGAVVEVGERQETKMPLRSQVVTPYLLNSGFGFELINYVAEDTYDPL